MIQLVGQCADVKPHTEQSGVLLSRSKRAIGKRNNKGGISALKIEHIAHEVSLAQIFNEPFVI